MCDYRIVEGDYYSGYTPVRQIRSKRQELSSYEDGYINNQQCWARFKCPDDMRVYWRRKTFYTESCCNYVTFYDVDSGHYSKYSGYYGSSSYFNSLYDSEVTFEFRTDGSVTSYRGFEIQLTCK